MRESERGEIEESCDEKAEVREKRLRREGDSERVKIEERGHI